ncbi:MAG: hypothetical protein CMJ84_07095 [Planctomycetes bacterium]|jgi:hypothetical protein|nr:hypothetical protein [Planctomycetota bacterium]MDP6409277.1 YCF48-related protein [Planctomycetota bacterium]
MRTSILGGLALLALSASPARAQTSDWSVLANLGTMLLGIDASDEDRVWACGAQNGVGATIYHSADGGQNWNLQAAGNAVAVWWSVIDMVSAQVGYVGGDFVFGFGSAAMKTVDGGQTWQPIQPHSGGFLVTQWRDVCALDADHVWYLGEWVGLGASSGVARSTNGGASFSWHESATGIAPRAVHFVDANTGWLACGEWPDPNTTMTEFKGLIARSDDGGATWVNQVQLPNGVDSYFIDVQFLDAQNGWAVADGEPTGRIYRTTDGGASWSIHTLPNPDFTLASVHMITLQEGWAAGWTMVGFNPRTVLFHTTDGGVSWTQDPIAEPYGPLTVAMASTTKGWTVGSNNLQVGAVLGYDGQGCPDPSLYCQSAPNSNGPGAAISAAGSTSVSADDLVLQASEAAVNQFGIFYYGQQQIQQPFGDGFRCVGGQVYRLPVVSTDFLGDVSYSLDLANPPHPDGRIDPGETWNFQFWYRDPLFGGSGFNLTEGLEATFCL